MDSHILITLNTTGQRHDVMEEQINVMVDVRIHHPRSHALPLVYTSGGFSIEEREEDPP